ncbi:hypothetical protein [Sphingomonas sp. IW22]|uniref:hypothetical protein n=1 Tax=Sphingomonas sp. IW22 TaxID=3242489 RepID=UPI0035207283
MPAAASSAAEPITDLVNARVPPTLYEAGPQKIPIDHRATAAGTAGFDAMPLMGDIHQRLESGVGAHPRLADDKNPTLEAD